MANRRLAINIAGATLGGISASLATLYGTATLPRFQPEDSIGFPALSIGDNYLATLQTGDILLFNQPMFLFKPVKWLFSLLQKEANGEDFEHMGVVVWHPTEHYPYVVEHTLQGFTVTPFEDRIGYSGSQDVLLRTLHLIRTPQMQKDAQEFLLKEAEKNKIETPGSKTIRWLKDILSLLEQTRYLSRSPIMPPALQRTLSISEISALSPEELEQFYETTKHGLESLRQTRVSLYSDMTNLFRSLRSTEDSFRDHLMAHDMRLHDENMAMEAQLNNNTNNNSSNNTIQALHDKMASSSPSSSSSSTKQYKSELSPRDLHLLLKKRDMLYLQLDKSYTRYRDATINTAARGQFNPLSPSCHNPFPDVELVARLYQHLNLLPRQEEDYDDLASGDIIHILPETLPEIDDTDRIDQYDHRKLNFHEIGNLLAVTAPHPKEYIPSDFRSNRSLVLNRGLLGQEQLIISSFHKPTLELRATGSPKM